MKSNELGYFAILCTAVVVARVSHASRLVFMRTLVCAISGEFSCDRLNRRFSCEKIFEKYVGHNRKQIQVVEHFKCIGSLQSADGKYCSKDTIFRVGIAKKRMIDMVGLLICRGDRGRNKNMKIKRVPSLVWTVLTELSDDEFNLIHINLPVFA